MKKLNFILIVLCLSILSIIFPNNTSASTASTTDYYVSTQGSDSNLGTESSPWKTIQKAANTVKQGDKVYIRGGIYNERVTLQTSGSEDNYITFINYPGEVPTIDGTGIDWGYDWDSLFEFDAKDYINLTGLRVINSSWFGIGSTQDFTGSENIIVQNCSTYNTKASGIIFKNGRNIILDGNSIEDACNGSAATQEGITLNNTTNFEIKNNHVFNITNVVPGAGGEGIDVKNGSTNGKIYNNTVNDVFKVSIYVDAFSKHQYNIEVYGNTIYNTTMGIAVATEASGFLENIRIYDNLVYNCVNWGLAVLGEGEDTNYTHAMKDISFENNTTKNIGDGDIFLNNAEAKNVVVMNNIFGGSATSIPIFVHGANLEETTIDHNLLNRVAEGHPTGTNSIVGDAKFVNIDPEKGNLDFRLSFNSLVSERE